MLSDETLSVELKDLNTIENLIRSKQACSCKVISEKLRVNVVHLSEKIFHTSSMIDRPQSGQFAIDTVPVTRSESNECFELNFIA